MGYGEYAIEYSYYYGSTEATLCHYYGGNNSSLTIPSTAIYDNVEYVVTEIGNDAFMECNELATIIIPESVTTIGISAFNGCSNLTNITIPESITTIGNQAFYECSNLMNINLPSNVVALAADAFYGTGWYNNQIDGVLYLNDYCLGYKGDEPTGDLYIQEGTKIVAEYAFIECYSLSSVVIPNSVTHIGSFAFFCTSLSEVTLGNSLTSIESAVFHSCNFLTSIDIPNSVTYISGGAFANCMNLTNVTIPNTVTSIGMDAFSFTNINSLILPNSLQTIGPNAFGCCFHLTGDLIIPNSVTYIDEEAFYLCDSLTSLTIGNSVSYIRQRAFNCSGLTSINVLAETPPDLQIIYCGGPFASVDKSIPVYVPYGTISAYQAAPGWNEFTNYQEMPSSSVTQTIDLSAGWNWCSFYVDITLDDLKSALVETLPGTSITISSQTQSTVYNGSVWRGQLSTLDVAMMYKIMVTQGCELTLEGVPVNAAEHPVTISNGYNWIAFPLSQSMSLSNAFAGFAVSGDVVSSQTQNATYNGTMWRGTLGSGILEPGKGYKYNSNATEPRTFTYPSAK